MFTSLCARVQVVGHKKGLYVMERADPLFLLMGLPTIPVVLVLGKMIRWEDYIVRMWQRYSYRGKLPSGMKAQTDCVITADIMEAGLQSHDPLCIDPQVTVVIFPESPWTDPVQEITSLCPGLCVELSSFPPSPVWWDGCCFDRRPLIFSALCW